MVRGLGAGAVLAVGAVLALAACTPSAAPAPSPSVTTPAPTPPGATVAPVPVPATAAAATATATVPATAATATATVAASPSVSVVVDARSALGVLGRLTVARNGPATGYARARFGDGWLDPDGNGCDAREDVLRRDLTGVVLRPTAVTTTTGTCRVVDRGTLRDPYSGATLAFVRGPSTSGLVQIDHVVSLANAWRTGAQRWTAARREAFANDPLNLLAATEATNQDKGGSDADQWLPPLVPARCAFAARQVAVKAKYGLTVRQAERDALAAVLVTCPGQALPA